MDDGLEKVGGLRTPKNNKTIKTITKNFSFIFIFNFETMQLRLYCPFNCNKTELKIYVTLRVFVIVQIVLLFFWVRSPPAFSNPSSIDLHCSFLAMFLYS